MGILDNLTGMLGGGQNQGGGQAQGAMNIIQQLVSQGAGQGQSSGIVGALLGAATGAMGGQSGAPGGLAGMLETLAANGLSEHVASWVSNKPNMPVSVDQIRGALGSDQVQQMAAASGLPVGDFLQHLAQHLPQAASEQAGVSSGG